MKIHEILQQTPNTVGQTLCETRKQVYNYIKSLVPKWPEYVVRDWLYSAVKKIEDNVGGNLGDHVADILDYMGLEADTQWRLIPDFKFSMDIWDPHTADMLERRAGGRSIAWMGIPKDAERHQTQAKLAKKEGGIRKEPVILIKRANGYELIEGWHRTIQHFIQYPHGYQGPAWLAVSKNVVKENTAKPFEYTTEKQIQIRIRQILYDRKLSGTKSNEGELQMLRRKLKDLRAVSENSTNNIKYTMPQFSYEWNEAVRYPELKKLGHHGWMNLAKSGQQVNVQQLGGLESIGNTTAPDQQTATQEFANLEANKIKRFKSALAAGNIELPIVIKTKRGKLDLLGGNTRFTGLVSHGIMPDVWYIDASSTTNENFADGRGPGRPGDSQRHGIPKNATIAQLEKAAKSPGRRGQLARWQLNMRRGQRKTKLHEADLAVTVNNHLVELLINPSYRRMVNTAAKLAQPSLRALYIPAVQQVLVWPAAQATHYEMATALVDQLNWNLGRNLQSAMTTQQFTDPAHPQSAILRLAPPLIDQSGRPTRSGRRAGDFAVVASPDFYLTDWWQRIARSNRTPT